MRKSLVVGLAACTLLLALAACTPADRVAARIVDSKLTFVACDSPVAQRISVLVRAPDNDDPTPPTYWQADGDGRIFPDEPITYGEAPDDFDNVITALSLPSDESRILVYLDKLDDDGEVVKRVGGNFVASWICADYWLQTGGAHSAEPCS